MKRYNFKGRKRCRRIAMLELGINSTITDRGREANYCYQHTMYVLSRAKERLFEVRA